MTVVTTQTPDLNATAARWQSALDAAARALEADRAVLPATEVSREAHHLTEERRETAALLRSVAALHHMNIPPWLSSGPVTPRSLGLPDSVEVCLFDLDGVLTDSDALHAAAWAQALEPVLLSLADEERAPYAPFDRSADYHAYFDGRLRTEGIVSSLRAAAFGSRTRRSPRSNAGRANCWSMDCTPAGSQHSPAHIGISRQPVSPAWDAPSCQRARPRLRCWRPQGCRI